MRFFRNNFGSQEKGWLSGAILLDTNNPKLRKDQLVEDCLA